MGGKWTITTWGELVELKYGKALRGYKDAVGDIPVFGTNGPIGWCNTPLCKYPSVIVGRKGAYRGIHYSEKPFYVIDTAFYIVPKTDINLKWAYYSLLTQDINSMDSGSAIPSTSREDFYGLQAKVPPRKIQDSIVEHLDALNSRIELNRQMNATLEAMAQALFKSWFIDFDPVIDNALAAGNPIPEELQARADVRAALGDKRKPLPEGIQKQFPSRFVFREEIGWVPEGWKVIPITKMVDSVSDTYPLKTMDKVVFLNTGDILEGEFLHSDYSKVSGLPGQAKKSIQSGDILFSEIRPKNKRYAFVGFDSKEYVVSTKLMVLRTRGQFNPLFPYFLLKQDHNINALQHIAESRSGTFPQITFSQLDQIKVTIPAEGELLNYFSSATLQSNFDRASALRAQSSTLGKIRDALLPKLLSGDLRIFDAEKMAAEAV